MGSLTRWTILQDEPHWVFHSPRQSVFPRTTLLSLQVALQEDSLKWALCYLPFPGLSCSGCWVLHRGKDPDGLCVLFYSQVQPTQSTKHLARSLSQVGHEFYAPPLFQLLSFPGVPQGHSPMCAVCVFWGVNLRLWHSWQMWTVQDPRRTWLATGSLLTVYWMMSSLWLRLQQPLAFWLLLSDTCLSDSGVGGP